MAGFLNTLSRAANQKALPEPRYISYPIEGQELFKDWDARLAIKDGFKSSVWVYASLRLIAKSLARVPWYLDVPGPNGESQQVWEDTPALDVLNEPNPLQGRHGLMELMVYHLMLAGNALWLKIKTGSPEVPTELHPLEPDAVMPVPGQGMEITKYNYRKGNWTTSYQPEDVVHFMLQDPARPHWGVSPVQAASRVIDTDVEAVKFNRNALKNRGVGTGLFSFDEDLSDEQFEEATDHVNRQYGGSENARKLWVLGNRARFTGMSATPVDLDFNNGRKFGLVEIAAAVGVLPALFAPDAATFSNLKEARKSLWIETVTALLEGARSTMNRSLIGDFYPNDKKVKYNYDLSDIDALRDEFETRVDSAMKMTEMGVPLNVASERMELGLDPVEGGDEPHGLSREVVTARIAGDMQEDGSAANADGEKEFPMPGPDGVPLDGVTIRREYKALSLDVVGMENQQTAELLKVARSLEPDLQQLFLRIIEELRDGIDEDELQLALNSGNREVLNAQLPYREMKEGINSSSTILKDVLLSAGLVALTQLSEGLGQGLDAAEFGLTGGAAFERAAITAENMVESTKGAMENAWNRLNIDQELKTFRLSKLYLKQVFGMNRNQEASAGKFFEQMVRRGAPIGQIEDGLAAYGSQGMQSRAALFAREESVIQAYRGRTETWAQAQQKGMLANARRTFVTSMMGNVCPICRPMHGQTIRMGEMYFSSYNGKFYKHPGPEWVHNTCHCGEIITSFR